MAPRRDIYLLEFYSSDGRLLRQVWRPLEAPRRTEDERRKAADKLRVWGDGRELPARKTILDTDPNIPSLQVLDDGTIWVRTCFHQRGLPDGLDMRYDVFAPTGELLKEVRLACPFDGGRDFWQLLADGSFLQFRNGRRALDNMNSGIEENEEDVPDDDEGYLSVVRYRRAP